MHTHIVHNIILYKSKIPVYVKQPLNNIDETLMIEKQRFLMAEKFSSFVSDRYLFFLCIY